MPNTPLAHQIPRRLHLLFLGLQVVAVGILGIGTARAQGLGSGTLQGIVKDPTGGVMQAVEVKISNPISGFTRIVSTDAAGRYVFGNLAPNPYHVSIEVEGFQKLERDVDVRSGVPVTLDLTCVDSRRLPTDTIPAGSVGVTPGTLACNSSPTPVAVSNTYPAGTNVAITATSVSRTNGGSPVRHSYRTHPNEYTSVRPSTGSDLICSGAT